MTRRTRDLKLIAKDMEKWVKVIRAGGVVSGPPTCERAEELID